MVLSAAQRLDGMEERVNSKEGKMEQRFTNLDGKLDGLAQTIGLMVTPRD